MILAGILPSATSERSPRALFLALATVHVLLLAISFAPVASAQSAPFGANVLVFDPSMATSDIQAAVDAVSAKQIGNQFGTDRYALLFKPGTYGSASAPLNFKVGYYTEVAGLGALPTDVVVNGSIDVYNQCDSYECTALSNFWRSLSNLTINVTTPNSGCYTGEFWAVSQAAPLRRVNLTGGNLTFMDYCTSPSYASGGFVADSQFSGGTIINGSQQQFYVRNSNLDGWSNGVWNQVFSGDVGAPAQSYPDPTYTTLASTPHSRERPFLTLDAKGKYKVFLPDLQRNSSGASWVTGTALGHSLSLDRFFLATPSTPIEQINLALLFGKNLLLTPGVYSLRRPIEVFRPDTIILGLGFPTLVPQDGRAAINVADVDGVRIAGLIVDAGPVNSPVLLRMGTGFFGLPLPRGGFCKHLNNPSSLHDVFFRVGGATPGSATTSLEVNSSDVLLDDIWAWRADHGNGVGWTTNTGDHGLVVNGDRVLATGLAVEHYQKEQTLWNGNAGETIFYQSELPYDVPSQTAWMDGNANGYPSYVVSSTVNTHQIFGSGIYSFFNQGINIVEDNATTLPVVPGVTLQDAGTVFLNGSGQITHVVNGVGSTVNASNDGSESTVVSYP